MDSDGTETAQGMTIIQKTALTTLILNLVLTALKFVLFVFSGSLAVLAEAWHSFSDIGTSFMVFVAVRTNQKAVPEPGEAPPKSRISPEQVVSVGIGIFLLVVAVFLILKFFLATPEPVKKPLMAGLIFIGFSLGSYLVYRLETNVGREHGSLGLLSDSMHARTDMMASLLTGFSLILYHLGIDIDKWVGGLIALIVLCFAVETIVNVVLSIHRRDRGVIFRYRYYTIFFRLFSPTTFRTVGEFLDRRLHIKFFGTAVARRAPSLILYAAVVVLLLWWLSTCIFTVAPSETCLVERFGRPLQTEAPLEAGLHFKAPWPADMAVKMETHLVRRMNIGNITNPQTFALLWTREHGTEIPFLSGDNNYFYPYLVIHYRIKNLYHFLYRHADPEGFLNETAHQATAKAFATKSFYEIAIDYRKEMVKDLKTGIQADLDRVQTGIEIVLVTVKDIHPPIRVADSYEGVIAAIQEKEKMIDEAQGYRNQKLPEARGEAARKRKDAEAYALELPLKAVGRTQKFLARIPEDTVTRRLTQLRLYLTTMLEGLQGRNKVIVDPAAGRPELWLDVKKLISAPGFDFDKAQF